LRFVKRFVVDFASRLAERLFLAVFRRFPWCKTGVAACSGASSRFFAKMSK